ncbi:unnamed protein product, partial [Rotaria socialis]
LSFNQPKFCPVVSWEANGTTVANDTMIGLSTIGMFIDTDNAIYVNDQETNSVQIWYFCYKRWRYLSGQWRTHWSC